MRIVQIVILILVASVGGLLIITRSLINTQEKLQIRIERLEQMKQNGNVPNYEIPEEETENKTT